MIDRHTKSEMERRRMIDISTIGVLFCLIIGFYTFGERNIVRIPAKEIVLPVDTSRIIVINIKPEMPEPKEAQKPESKKMGEVVTALLPIEPEIKPFVLTPVDIIPAGFLPRIPGIQEDTTIHSPQFVQKKPEITYRVKPEYPAIALLTGQEGLVILSAVIGKDGAIERIGILKSNRFFDRAAIEALKQYTFTPAIQNDQPVRVEMSIPFRFDIK